METIICPLCGVAAKANKDIQLWDVQCERCGYFRAYEDFLITTPRNTPQIGLSGVARESYERGSPLEITAENRADHEGLAPKSVHEKTMRLHHAIARKSSFPGQLVTLTDAKDYPLAYASNAIELGFYTRFLAKLGFLDNYIATTVDSHFRLSPEGWAQIEADKGRNVDSGKVFVAMWFAPHMNAAYAEGIKPALEDDCGYRSIRVDTVEHLGKIDDRIIAEIRESRFVVADFTGQRGGVYYESGFAAGLGLPVIWLCREDDIHEVHFDTRQFNHIVWQGPSDLREKLSNRIRAVIGLGPGKQWA